MKKLKRTVIGMLLATTLLIGSTVVASAATMETCNHEGYARVLSGDGAPYKVTYTHPACVAYQPNGTPIIVDCTATDTRQNMKESCSHCKAVIRTYVDVINITHSISH